MKKIIILSILISGLSACKKETKVVDIVVTKTDGLATSRVEKPESPVKLNEVSGEKVSELLKAKQNDTIYVTNFFATWCGPCMQEIPHFKEKMTELKGQKIKFTFVNMDEKTDWDTAVKKFAADNNLSRNVVLLDGKQLKPEFFKTNFKTWTGESIPFTVIKKGDKSDETIGSMSKEELSAKLDSFK